MIPKPLTISLDYDKTWTADPDLWRSFANMAKALGHRVVMITMRRDNKDEELPTSVTQHVAAVYYTDRQAKVDYALEKKLNIDIWIDDSPHWLMYDAGDRTIKEQVKENDVG